MKPHTAVNRMMALLRSLRDEGKPLPKSDELCRVYGGDGDGTLRLCAEAGLIKVSIETGGRRKVTFLQEQGFIIAEPKQRLIGGLTTTERYTRLYQRLRQLADQGAPLPSSVTLERETHCKIVDALAWMVAQGLIETESSTAGWRKVAILETGRVVQTVRAGNLGGRKVRKRRTSADNAGVFKPISTTSIWGDLAPAVTFLRSRGDVIERAGSQRYPAAKVNGRVVELDEVRDRADRVRERHQRAMTRAATYEAIY